jgi:hypothetical protein
MKMTEKKCKALYWCFKIASVIISCALPIWAILEKFPLWVEDHGTGSSIGAGLIMSIIVLLIVFRKAVFDFIKDKANLNNAPPIVVWIVLLVLSYLLTYLSEILKDINIVFWMGLIGCAVGTLLTFIAENAFGKKKEEKTNE